MTVQSGHNETTTEPFRPTLVTEIELSQPLPDLLVKNPKAEINYAGANLLVRLHRAPVGILELLFENGDILAEQCAVFIWNSLEGQINEHLKNDELPAITTLTAKGIVKDVEPQCLINRLNFLKTAPFITVILCTRNRSSKLGESLSKLLNQDYPQFEILVVDNAPSDTSTEDVIRRYVTHTNPVIRYVREPRPGLSWARNCGLANAHGTIVAFIDDDEHADEQWLTEIAKGFATEPEVACVTGMILPGEIETQPQEWFEQFGGHSKGLNFQNGIHNMTTHYSRNLLFPAPPFGAGGNMAFKTDVIRSLGGFDNALGAGTFSLGGEDTVSFYEVITNGYTLVFQAAAIVRHFHYRELSGLRRQLHGYGVGLTAFITRCIIKNPLTIFRLLVLVPKAANYLLSPKSPGKSRMKEDYPKELTRYQRAGMLLGPIAYIRSLWHLRAIRRKFGDTDAK